MENLFARSAYQIFLYVLLFVGTAAMGGFVGYIASFLYHEGRKDRGLDLHGSESDTDGVEDADEADYKTTYKSPR